MTGVRSRRALSLGAAIVLLASCGGTAPATTSQQAPLPTSPSPTPTTTQVSISAKCGGPFHPGQYVGLACIVTVGEAPSNPVRGVYADFSAFGRPAQQGAVQCPACGAPPRTFDLDLRVPADMTPAMKTFAVWAIYADGSRADTTASIEIAGPPSQLSISTDCGGTVHPGQTVDGACFVLVQDVNYPEEQRFDVWADLRSFGQAGDVRLVPACSGCGGGPPWAYVLTLHVPANTAPGLKRFAVWAGTVYAGAGEHRADTTVDRGCCSVGQGPALYEAGSRTFLRQTRAG